MRRLTGCAEVEMHIAPASPWENGFAEPSFSRLRGELLSVEECVDLAEARWFAKRRQQGTTKSDRTAAWATSPLGVCGRLRLRSRSGTAEIKKR